MDRRERYEEPQEALRLAMEGALTNVWKALPAIVVRFDAEKMICDVQPAIRMDVRTPKGEFQEIDLPVLLDCPVVFQGGGGYTLTFPIKPGDECLVVIADRCIDLWWQFGGVQRQFEYRLHDLSDGFVLCGVRSQPRRFDVNPDHAELRRDANNEDENDVFVRLSENQVTITAPQIVMNGNVQINGERLRHNAKNVGDTHTHSGVIPGGGDTDFPNT